MAVATRARHGRGPSASGRGRESDWSHAPPVAPTRETTGTLTKSADERKAILDRTLAARGAEGWRIENRSDFQATVATGKRVNHILHLILTILTAGLWAIVWIILAITGGIKRQIVTVDEYGNVLDQNLTAVRLAHRPSARFLAPLAELQPIVALEVFPAAS
jgi:hypothetical protein